ncbi:hypothetical protein GHT06_017061 [Daphnia sinensis]|uniref:C2H2-type domain-containing protein n=1 Tax=Daphnia sinensis TaxID=1820382 RepID=A0AAD5LGJ1_9CRUS|nr:hypothetical protein GHT06_017061 [Daphnia sinensis]
MADSQRKDKFNCKYADCLYSEGSRLYFQKYRYLKQHYDKVHNTKIYECSKCLKKFGTTTLQKSHMSYCGREFKCSCGVVYKSNEALLTHAKRKRHPLGPLPRAIGIESTNGKHNQSPSAAHSLSINFSAGSQLIILQSNRSPPCSAVKKNDFNVVLNPESPQNPCSPWLGLQAFSAETQTVDEDAVLRPFNLCNIQTQTPWNEISDDDDTTELAHTETQTPLSSFFIDDGNVPECQGERRMNSFLVKFYFINKNKIMF